jgi:CRISPR/Cas system-associated exonuclease Cas4 (RecB family)
MNKKYAYIKSGEIYIVPYSSRHAICLKKTLEKIQEAIKNGQSRDTEN